MTAGLILSDIPATPLFPSDLRCHNSYTGSFDKKDQSEEMDVGPLSGTQTPDFYINIYSGSQTDCRSAETFILRLDVQQVTEEASDSVACVLNAEWRREGG